MPDKSIICGDSLTSDLQIFDRPKNNYECKTTILDFSKALDMLDCLKFKNTFIRFASPNPNKIRVVKMRSLFFVFILSL